IATCFACGAVRSEVIQPSTNPSCPDCGSELETSWFTAHVSPSAFTTAFRSHPVEENEDLLSFRRVVTIEAGDIVVTPCPGTNASIGTSDKAHILRLNAGLSNGPGDPVPFNLVPVECHNATVREGVQWKLPNQMLLQEQCNDLERLRRIEGRRDPVTVRL